MSDVNDYLETVYDNYLNNDFLGYESDAIEYSEPGYVLGDYELKENDNDVPEVFLALENNDVIEKKSSAGDKDITNFVEIQISDSEISNILTEITRSMERDEQEACKMMPRVIAIKKKKLLIAIDEIPDKKLNEEEENFMKTFTSIPAFVTFEIQKLFEPETILWKDSKAQQTIRDILKKHAKFDLPKYLECAKIVFLAYSGQTENNLKTVTDAMEYTITHARLFGDTTKTFFRTDEIIAEIEFTALDTKKIELSLPSNKLFNKINQIIQELSKTYDDAKFIILNVNTTYFTLLMLRRIVKNEKEFFKAFKNIHTHDNYVKLCPMPLDNQIPKCEFKICERNLVNCAYLAIETYLTTTDERTKRILRATCILYMEWNGLQLPELFFKAVKIYKVKPVELLDLIFGTDSEYPIILSCFNISDEYYDIYELLKTGVTNLWFPYCRVLDGAHHVHLSAKKNIEICSILAHLVDLKIGLDRSTIRKSHWVISTDKCVQTAKMLYEKLNKNL